MGRDHPLKYDPLKDHLSRSSDPILTLSFTEIERIIGTDLPASARRHQAWWANNESSPGRQCWSWIGGGYLTEALDLNAGTVTFRRR